MIGSTPRSRSFAVLGLCAGGLLAPAIGAAADTNLQARVERLEKLVTELQAENQSLRTRVIQLESQRSKSDPPTKNAAGAEQWQDRANWRKLKHGMPAADVEAILGPPLKVDAEPHWTDWDYKRNEFEATVRFAPPPQGGVIGWREP